MATLRNDWQTSALLWRPHKEGQLDVPFRRKKWQNGSFHVMVGGPRFNLFSLPNEKVAAVFGVMAVCTNLTFHIRIWDWKRKQQWHDWLEEQAKSQRKQYVCASLAFGRRIFLSLQAIDNGADVRNTFYHVQGCSGNCPTCDIFHA